MAASTPNQESSRPNSGPIPTLNEIRERTQQVFGVRPCLWQLKVAEALLKGDKDVLCTVGTGMGKTLGFWMPLLFRPGGIQIVVTPLNMLGRQNASSLAKAGIRAIAINSETATPANFATFHYRAIAVSPEQIMKPGGMFEKLLKDPLFTSRLISIVIDEAHCLTEWGEFRPEYTELGRLRYILPSSTPLMITSATLTAFALTSALRLLHMHTDRMVIIRRSSDRPNIKIGVKKIKYTLNSYTDLAFLIPEGWKPGHYKCRTLSPKAPPPELRDKIKWFNSDMTMAYKEAELENLVSGETWGLCTTDSFGMGMDVADIVLIIQWRATCKLATLWQQFGRAARNQELTGTVLLFAEKDHFDDERATKAARKAQREKTQKRKTKAAGLPASLRPAKCMDRSSPNKHMEVPSIEANEGSTASHDGGNADEGSSDEESDDETYSSGTHLPQAAAPCATGLEGLLKAIGNVGPTTKQDGRSRKRQKRGLDPGVDYLINAEIRTGLMCRRKVFDVCFDNGAAGGNLPFAV
ncbi:hypothetical protein HYDPIDRAFT_178049 [Hydnomerulius pinastri MD-312]|uniref:DNA 3'-5' helicase n=1 Tax=Hydnomerulius pinastri MD-312 TaxID=994086 RepID=A0A0C9VLS0_9AGAM|nr:hypothetical protein HYDPIDRAFT_178049 [Hydnomerulius pinastri MD-312]